MKENNNEKPKRRFHILSGFEEIVRGEVGIEGIEIIVRKTLVNEESYKKEITKFTKLLFEELEEYLKETW